MRKSLWEVVAAAAWVVLWMSGPGLTRGAAQSQAEQSGSATAAAAQEAVQQPSLGSLARKVRAERANQKPATKVFTNSNMPTEGGLSVVGPSAPQAQTAASPGVAGSEGHDAKWFTAQMAQLQGQLNMHQRELDVLQQKLNLSQTIYYPDPNKQLEQQHSMSDIKELQKAVEHKQQQIADDQKAVEDLRTQLQREGGDPGWLRAGMAAAGSAPALPPATKVTPGKHDKAYWQALFQEARQRVAAAKDQERLAEEELDLLKRRQASELPQDAQSEISAKLTVTEESVRKTQDAVSKAEEDLDRLKQEFGNSGAPDDWIEPE